MKLLHDFSLAELKTEVEQLNLKMPRYRAEQVYKWLSDYATFDEMTNIPLEMREILKESYISNPVKIEKELISKMKCSSSIFVVENISLLLVKN